MICCFFGNYDIIISDALEKQNQNRKNTRSLILVTNILIDGSDDSLNHTLEELEKFSKISGLKINYDKTQIVWIGSKKYSSDTMKTKWKLSWGKDTFKLLGINFNTDLDKMAKGNLQRKSNF